MLPTVRTFWKVLLMTMALSSLLVSSRLSAASKANIVVALDGTKINSIFDGLTPLWFAREEIINEMKLRHPNRRSSKLSSLELGEFGARVVQVQCPTCPPTEACSGSFTVIVPLPPGAGCDNPVACPSVNNFTIDPSNPNLKNIGEQNSYCGPSCCVDAEAC